MPSQDETANSAEAVDNITLSDYDSAMDEPLLNADAYMGGDAEPPEPQTFEERRENFKSRLKSGWTPPDEKVQNLPARGAGVPTIDEWLDFFSRIVVTTLTDFAIEMAFRGVDEELLSDREIKSIKLDAEERGRIAKPFAEFAHRNKFTRKHGREIIAAAGSIDAILQLGLWYTRMTRIAMKYQERSGRVTRQARFRKPPQAARTAMQRNQERNTQRVVVVDPEVSADERLGQSTPNHTANGHEREWRPDVGGPVFNPGG
jgi:hypothetical protein